MAGTYHKMWDQLDDSYSESEQEAIRPLWNVDFDDDTKVVDWFQHTFNIVAEEMQSLKEEYRINKELYKGNHFPVVPIVPRNQDRTQRPRRDRKVVVNHLFEFTEQWVSRMTRFKPAIDVLPSNNEHNDRQAAKIGKMVIDYLFYISNIDSTMEQMARGARVYGEQYLEVCWNPDKGTIHPDFDEANLDEDGRQKIRGVKTEDGEDIEVDRPVRVGEVEFNIYRPWNVYIEPNKRDFDSSEWIILEDIVDEEVVMAMYPDKADGLKDDIRKKTSKVNPDFTQTAPGKLKVYKIYHKSTALLHKGRFIKMTMNTVLENSDLPYSHGKLPVVRLTDIDVPGEPRGMSYFKNLAPLNILINNVTALMYKNIALASHVKWMMPKGATNIVNLGNRASVVEYTGPIAPKAESPSVVRGDLFQFISNMREEAERIAGIFGISRGEPPPGIRAGIALQFLEEQENQRAHTAITKHNEMVRQTALLALSVAGDYYDESDQRLVRILGRDNQFIIKALEETDLSRPFDVRVQNTSALPESKAGRIQTVIDLHEQFGPEVVPPRQVVDMIQFGQPERYYDQATVAIKKAESENEDMLEGHDVPEPSEWEEHLSHWHTHMKAIQSRSFENVPQAAQEKIFKHILTHEYLMFQKSLQNPLLAEKLQLLESWPAFYTLPPPPPAEPLPAPGAVPPGEAFPEGLPPELAAAGAPPPLPQGVPVPTGDPIPQEIPLPAIPPGEPI